MSVEIEAFAGFPYAMLVVDAERRIVARNAAADDLVAGMAKEPQTCCQLLGCREPGSALADACLTELAVQTAGALPEVRVDVGGDESGRAVWVTAARVRNDGSIVVHQLRPGDARDRRRRTQLHWTAKPHLRITTLGHTQVFSREGSIGGGWLDGRGGQLLKYLLVERHRVVSTDELVENLWRGSDVGMSSSIRYYVHDLRQRLEPDRPKRGRSSFIVFRHGGYGFDFARVHIDANDFERDVKAGLEAFARGDHDVAKERLEAGLALYQGDFLSDEAYVDWVLVERDRLRSLAAEALSALSRLCLSRGEEEDGIAALMRLAEFQPFDSEMQRELLSTLLASGRRTDAMRRYEVFRRRLRREFNEEPEFTLGDLASVPSPPP